MPSLWSCNFFFFPLRVSGHSCCARYTCVSVSHGDCDTALGCAAPASGLHGPVPPGCAATPPRRAPASVGVSAVSPWPHRRRTQTLTRHASGPKAPKARNQPDRTAVGRGRAGPRWPAELFRSLLHWRCCRGVSVGMHLHMRVAAPLRRPGHCIGRGGRVTVAGAARMRHAPCAMRRVGTAQRPAQEEEAGGWDGARAGEPVSERTTRSR